MPDSDAINEAIVETITGEAHSTAVIAQVLRRRFKCAITVGAVRKRLYRLAKYGFVDSEGEGAYTRWTAV